MRLLYGKGYVLRATDWQKGQIRIQTKQGKLTFFIPLYFERLFMKTFYFNLFLFAF